VLRATANLAKVEEKNASALTAPNTSAYDDFGLCRSLLHRPRRSTVFDALSAGDDLHAVLKIRA
jgi:hypothetical protein